MKKMTDVVVLSVRELYKMLDFCFFQLINSLVNIYK